MRSVRRRRNGILNVQSLRASPGRFAPPRPSNRRERRCSRRVDAVRHERAELCLTLTPDLPRRPSPQASPVGAIRRAPTPAAQVDRPRRPFPRRQPGRASAGWRTSAAPEGIRKAQISTISRSAAVKGSGTRTSARPTTEWRPDQFVDFASVSRKLRQVTNGTRMSNSIH